MREYCWAHNAEGSTWWYAPQSGPSVGSSGMTPPVITDLALFVVFRAWGSAAWAVNVYHPKVIARIHTVLGPYNTLEEAKAVADALAPMYLAEVGNE